MSLQLFNTDYILLQVQYNVIQFYGENVTKETIPTLLLHACCHSVESLINVTDKFESAQKACCSDGLVQFFVKDVFPLLLDVNWGEVGVWLIHFKLHHWWLKIFSLFTLNVPSKQSHGFLLWKDWLQKIQRSSKNYFSHWTEQIYQKSKERRSHTFYRAIDIQG